MAHGTVEAGWVVLWVEAHVRNLFRLWLSGLFTILYDRSPRRVISLLNLMDAIDQCKFVEWGRGIPLTGQRSISMAALLTQAISV